MKQLFAVVFLLNLTIYTNALVKLPSIFTHHMVLQRDKPIAVWGTAATGEKISIELNKQKIRVIANSLGEWKVQLNPEKAGGPFILSIKGENTIRIQDILIGDIWVCSGQSNMEMKIGSWGFIHNYEAEITAANYNRIRQFEVPLTTATSAQSDTRGGEWLVCNPNNAAKFSAVAYFFARELHGAINIPIGILNTTWGGTNIESWISKTAFEKNSTFSYLMNGLKQINLNELIIAKQKKYNQRIAEIKKLQSSHGSDTTVWKQVDFNDQDWGSLKLPGIWEEQGLDYLDGEVWFRKTIELTNIDIVEPALLELAMIDDMDETFINGVKVGSTFGYNKKRVYSIPKGILKAGKNTIVIKVNDTGGGGGVYGKSADMQLLLGVQKIALAGNWKYTIGSMKETQISADPNSFPSLLYNAMIHPLTYLGIKGVIWYQGEANAGRAFQYRTAFPLLINDWRAQWKQGDFPFYFAQLSSWHADYGNSKKGSGWAELREAQANTLSLKNTGMAITIDIGDSADIHPKNKLDVGKRLAAIALNKTYHKKNTFSGPELSTYSVNGNKIELTFKFATGGLLIKNEKKLLQGIEIAGSDQQFYPAQATMVGANKLLVFNKAVLAPVAVRYAWTDDAGAANLFNKAGFPAAPFRTDNWKGITEMNKYQIAFD